MLTNTNVYLLSEHTVLSWLENLFNLLKSFVKKQMKLQEKEATGILISEVYFGRICYRRINTFRIKELLEKDQGKLRNLILKY